MIVVNIILGLAGLGIVILVHELGHFTAAKLSGITVEVFSIGWGRKLFSYKRGETEYRISMLPIGGYCKMKGEEILRSAVEHGAERFPDDAGSIFSVSPWKRVLTFFSGPGANFFFAVVVLSIIWFFGFSLQTFGNRIVLLSESPFARSAEYPADEAGLQTGDRIVEMSGDKIETFQDIEAHVAPHPGRIVETVVERGGRFITVRLTPELDKNTGVGRIGVAAWVDPVIAEVTPTAARAGLAVGDMIVSANGVSVRNSIDLYAVLVDQPAAIEVKYRRDGTVRDATVPIGYTEEGGMRLGFAFKTITVTKRERNPFVALGRGASEAFETFVLSLKSIGLLFRGVDMKSTVSGPIRLTYLVGEVTTRGFGRGFGDGLIVLFRFLSLLSVALGFMNLLPIPALDGGMILLLFGEIILGKPVRPRVFYRYQIIGFIIILGVLVLTTFNDVLFFIGG